VYSSPSPRLPSKSPVHPIAQVRRSRPQVESWSSSPGSQPPATSQACRWYCAGHSPRIRVALATKCGRTPACRQAQDVPERAARAPPLGARQQRWGGPAPGQRPPDPCRWRQAVAGRQRVAGAWLAWRSRTRPAGRLVVEEVTEGVRGTGRAGPAGGRRGWLPSLAMIVSGVQAELTECTAAASGGRGNDSERGLGEDADSRREGRRHDLVPSRPQ